MYTLNFSFLKDKPQRESLRGILAYLWSKEVVVLQIDLFLPDRIRMFILCNNINELNISTDTKHIIKNTKILKCIVQ